MPEFSLQFATGGGVDGVEDLLGLQCHPPPRLVRCAASQRPMERVEHVDLLTWCMPRVVFRNLKTLTAAVHVEVANVGCELRLHEIEADV